MLLIGVKTMKRKEPGDKFKTTTISLEPGLYEAFDTRVKEERKTRSEVIATLIQSWLSGEPVTRPTGDPAPIPVIDMDKLTREITDRVLRSIPQVTPTLKPEQTQITITPPEPEDQGEEPKPDQDKDKDQKQDKPKPDRVIITEEIRAELIAHFKNLEAAGMKDADITRAAFGKKTSLVSLIKYEMDNPKRQKAITSEQYTALMAVVPLVEEKSSPEGT